MRLHIILMALSYKIPCLFGFSFFLFFATSFTSSSSSCSFCYTQRDMRPCGRQTYTCVYKIINIPLGDIFFHFFSSCDVYLNVIQCMIASLVYACVCVCVYIVDLHNILYARFTFYVPRKSMSPHIISPLFLYIFFVYCSHTS